MTDDLGFPGQCASTARPVPDSPRRSPKLCCSNPALQALEELAIIGGETNKIAHKPSIGIKSAAVANSDHNPDISENACISLDNKKHVGLEKDTPTRRTRAKVPRPRDNFASTPRLASLIQRRRLNLPFSVADLLLSNSQPIPLSVSTLIPS